MTEFTSLLLDRPVALVEPFGESESSFIGGGRAGAGGTPDGAWDFLIGPTYSSPNFLHEERLSVGWHGGRNRSVAPAMHRVAGSGLLCGRQRVGDLEVEVWEVAPWDGQEILRVVALTNCGGAILRRIRVQAFVRAPGERIQRIETLVRQGGSLQWFGLVNEFYGPDGTPNQHNLRPFETGPLTEALIVTNSSTEKEAARGL